MVPGGSNGELPPKSIRNPVFFALDCQVTVVPALTQKNPSPLAPAMLGVAEDDCDVRLTLIVHADPHVLLALHMLAGFGCEQASLLSFFLSSAAAKLAISRTGNRSRAQRIVER